MSRDLSRIVGVALLGAVLAGCASSAPNSPDSSAQRTAATLPGKPACFWLRSFDGSWTALNQTELIVYAPLTSDPYLIKLFEPVINLKFDQRLGFQDTEHTGRICDNTADFLVVPDFAPHRVTITAVRQLTKPEVVQLLRANGLKVPKNLQG
jgi:hypothetical protein